MEKQNFYEVLGVEKTATADEIKSSYRKLAKKYHPDLNPNNDAAAQKFKEVNEAYETLSDEGKRAQYDAELEGRFAGFGGSGFDFSGGGFGDDIINNIFNMFTGGGARQGASAQTRGKDISMNLVLTFEEAVKGTKKDISFNKNEACSSCKGTGAKDGKAFDKCPKCKGTGKIQYVSQSLFSQTINVRPCDACGGTGKIIKEKCPDCGGKGFNRKPKNLKVDIPAGVDNDNIVRVRGEGDACPNGAGPNGDLLLNIAVRPHKLLKRKGNDLFCEITVSMMQAVTGGKVEIPYIDGTISQTLPEGVQSGYVLYIRGKGVRSRGVTGDMYVTVSVETPKSLSSSQKEALRKFYAELGDKNTPKTKAFEQSMNEVYRK